MAGVRRTEGTLVAIGYPRQGRIMKETRRGLDHRGRLAGAAVPLSVSAATFYWLHAIIRQISDCI